MENPQYREVRKGKVMGKRRKYAGGGTRSGHAQQDFGRENSGQAWKVPEITWEKRVEGCERKYAKGGI